MSTKITVWILGDQLLKAHPALQAAEAEAEKTAIRVLIIESNGRSRKLPYQKKKLVLLFSAMRHYAKQLEEQGYTVDYVKCGTFSAGLKEHIDTHAPDQIYTMAAADYNGRFYQNALSEEFEIPANVLPNTQFLLSQHNPYPDPGDKNVIMEYFYRDMRRHFGILMEEDEPVGGEWNFDKENRKPLPKDAKPPAVLHFEPDDITQQVMAEIGEETDGYGMVEGFGLAVTHQQAEEAFAQFLKERFAQFGAYEDAMSQQHHTIFHSVISPYLNIGLLEPLPLIKEAEAAYHQGGAPINSVEGFVRQILGWREFMYWQYWRQMPEMRQKNSWNAERDLPDFFWNGRTQMHCLSTVINRAIDSGYTHHIERLMILSNFAMLTGLNPQAVNDWFQTLYIDAYEWVMVSNVIGMGLNADGGITATKPYISSANYINKMSDFCGSCHFNKNKRHGEDACPFNFLYWNFLLAHEEKLRGNPRLGRNVLGLRHLDSDERTAVQKQATKFLENLTSK